MIKEFKTISRKDFLKTAGSTALFAALGISIHGCSNVTNSESEMPDGNSPGSDKAITIDGDTITLNLNNDEISKLKNAGEWLLIRGADVLVVNVDGNVIRAFTSVCTHSGCNTSWAFSNSQFVCQCHGSKFNTSGQVTQGPANSDLEEFQVSRDGDTVTINK
ncbi:MAG: Rieske (2Fe-2S) protein [Balneolaceae bacterium]